MKWVFKINAFEFQKKRVLVLFKILGVLILGILISQTYSFSFVQTQKHHYKTKATTPSSVKEVKLKVQKYQLANGMTVLLHIDRRIPMVAVQQWYRVGSFDEEPQRSGLAHFFEHLMFRGTKKYPDGEFDRLLSQVGGENNASTSRDYTNYLETVPKRSLKLLLKLEADRMGNLILNDTIIQKERETVKVERRMRTENSPWGFAFETLMLKTFGDHQYAHSVLGSMKDLNQTQLKDFKAFYKKYYAPNNSVLVLVGDFNPSQAKSWIKKYFGSIPRTEIHRKPSKALPHQTKKTYLRVSDRFDSRKLGIYFQAPPMGTAESFALDIVCEALAGDEASSLHMDLVEKRKVATDVYISNYSLKHAGVLVFYASISGKKSFRVPEIVFYNEVTRIQKEGLSPEVLRKAKDKIMLEYIESLKSLSGKANVLASSETLQGDYTAFFKDLKSYESVTNQDIMNVVNKYIKISKANVLDLGK